MRFHGVSSASVVNGSDVNGSVVSSGVVVRSVRSDVSRVNGVRSASASAVFTTLHRVRAGAHR